MKLSKRGLGDLFDFLNGKSIKPGGTGQIPVYGSNGIIGGSGESLYCDGVIIGRVGAYCGSVEYCPGPFWPSDNTIVAAGKEGQILPRYGFYLLKNLDLHRWAGGAAQPLLTHTVLRALSATVPTVADQGRILHVLAAYDDLIENNTRRIKILEEIASSLYREWFVNFRFPGYGKARFVSTSDGRFPVGWVQPFPDHVDFKEGPGLRNWQYRNQGIPFLNIRTLLPNDIDLKAVNYLDPIEVEQKYTHFLLEAGDHVVSSSGTLGRIATVRFRHLPIMLNTSIIRMRPKGERMGRWQLKHFLQSDYFQNQIRAAAGGVAQPNYGPSHLKGMWVIASPKEIAVQYEGIVTSLEDQIANFAERNHILRMTRDLLLPRLIAGEIDVSSLPVKPKAS